VSEDYLGKNLLCSNFQSIKRINLEVRKNLPLERTNVYLGVQDVENSKPVFDPLRLFIIKDGFEDGNLGNLENCIF